MMITLILLVFLNFHLLLFFFLKLLFFKLFITLIDNFNFRIQLSCLFPPSFLLVLFFLYCCLSFEFQQFTLFHLVFHFLNILFLHMSMLTPKILFELLQSFLLLLLSYSVFLLLFLYLVLKLSYEKITQVSS